MFYGPPRGAHSTPGANIPQRRSFREDGTTVTLPLVRGAGSVQAVAESRVLGTHSYSTSNLSR